MADRIEIENREELFFFLAEAAELEHLLCGSYLFAAFSLKRDPSEGLTPAQQAAVSVWEQQLVHIAVQEMGHLALVNNLQVALGGAPLFQRPSYPQHGKYYPPHIELTLAPFNEATVERFVFLEQPREGPAEGGPPPTAPERSEKTVTDHEVVPEPQSYATVGQLYDAIEAGIRGLVDRHGEGQVFVGPPAAQATEALFDLTGLIAVTDYASACRAIAQIVEEGEGTRGERDDAHYGLFRQMQREYRDLLEEDPRFVPSRPVVANPCTRLPSDATGAALIDEQRTVDLMDLFNAVYGLMLLQLGRFYIQDGETTEESDALVGTAISTMTEVLAPLGRLLTQLPAGRSFPEQTSGPGFEVHRALQPPPHRRAAAVLLHEKWAELLDYSARLRDADGAPPGLDAIHEALARTANGLAAYR